MSRRKQQVNINAPANAEKQVQLIIVELGGTVHLFNDSNLSEAADIDTEATYATELDPNAYQDEADFYHALKQLVADS